MGARGRPGRGGQTLLPRGLRLINPFPSLSSHYQLRCPHSTAERQNLPLRLHEHPPSRCPSSLEAHPAVRAPHPGARGRREGRLPEGHGAGATEVSAVGSLRSVAGVPSEAPKGGGREAPAASRHPPWALPPQAVTAGVPEQSEARSGESLMAS